MKITKINTQLKFGKTAVATCNVKEKSTQKVLPATIYKMNPLEESDVREIRYSKNTHCLRYGIDIERENAPYNKGREFYLLKVDKTGEVVSCAQTLHRFRTDNIPHPGLSTMLEEASENAKFENGAQPLVAYIAQRASDRYDKSVISVTGTEEPATIQKKLKFKETETEGVYALSKRRFINFINRAKQENQLEVMI
ncbi:MAG: hypothetical protein IJY61_07480 [Candidatus Gastranaerophilales bacterium]|nr:hypothetical protein [Candidatus Gastranaerophilales bacterium]